jgi:hypothetical protein
MEIIFFFLALAYLILFCYYDFKSREVENVKIGGLLLGGLAYRFIINDIASAALCIILMFAFAVLLWKRNIFGGADAKALIALSPMLLYFGVPSMFGTFIAFIIVFGVVGIFYSAAMHFLFREKEIPFMPAIAIAYGLSYFFHVH